MPANSPSLIRRVTPGGWAALAWAAGIAYSLVVLVRLPGESRRDHYRGLLMAEPNQLWLAACVVASLCGCLLLRRSPLAALGLLLTGTVLGAAGLHSTEIDVPLVLGTDVALWSVAATRPRREVISAAAMAALVLLGYPIGRVLAGFVIGTSTALAVALTAVVAVLLGNSAGQARRHAAALGESAAARAVAGERLRIARELHDMVAHSIGIIALQAGAARRVLTTQPEHARDALGQVETAGRETLSGLRRMLVALRAAEDFPDGEAPLTPAPGLADLDRLAQATTTAGVAVDIQWRGERRTLPPEVDLSAYRIVQEALTNVVRHAGARSCQVTIDCGENDVSIEVLDGGGLRATQPAGAGFGLLGMQERVTLLHGGFSAGPRPGGGFRVAATLPVRHVAAGAR
ncbi:sensor histidine kinase [Kitasatospora sp. NPDC094015]|uniref:sensor histidine kinase n=1 Tax=Kitasatospora sp. NPDC094015 TaxID=3155205 RepID=UPI00331F20A3